MRTITCLFLSAILLLTCNACGNQNKKQEVAKDDFARVAQWGFPISEEYLQTYVGTFCYSTTFRHNEADYFMGYNTSLHAIDILDLTNEKPYKQILLDREGNNGVLTLKGVEFYKDGLILEDDAYFLRMDFEGKISSRKAKAELFGQFDGYSSMKPGLSLFFSMYSFFLFNPDTGEIAVTLYANDTTNKSVKIVLISCENWEVTESVDITYPDYILKEGNMGVLSSINAFPCADNIFYNFPASSNIYSYNRKTGETNLFEITSSITDNFLRVAESNNSGEDLSIISGYYFPLRYDTYRKKFWRIQMGKKDPTGTMYTKRSYAISCIDLNMKEFEEYPIPQDLGLYSNSLFFEKGVLFPYLEAVEEDQIIFYLIETR